MKRIVAITSLLLMALFAFAGVPLGTIEDHYYRYLAVAGAAEDQTLNWRTQNGNAFTATGELSGYDTWGILSEEGSGAWRMYGPTLFASLNSAAPYGQNDAALWQGKGLNSQLRFGIEYRSEHLSAILKPELDFSQNLGFETMKAASSYDSPYAYFWSNIDMPQRFGDRFFFTFDWGDSEIRFDYKSFTVGFGTQSVWTGPGYLNSMIHSNNAPTYPRLDFGLKRTSLPFGDVEIRFWAGISHYSKYYRNGYDDKRKVFTGISSAISPSLVPNLTFAIDGAVMYNLDENWWKNLFGLGTPFLGNGNEDGKMQFSANWRFPSVGLEIYGALAIDDWLPDGASPKIVLGLIRYPFHTMAYQLGLKKSIEISPKDRIHGMLVVECSMMEMSQDFYAQWPYTFYSHGDNSFTNGGQIMGAGSGWGGNSQILAFELYYPNGTSTFFVERSNPDNNFIYSLMINRTPDDYTRDYLYSSFKSNFTVGARTAYFASGELTLNAGLMYNLIINDRYKMRDGIVDTPSNHTIENTYGNDKYLHNFRMELGISLNY